MPPNETYLLLDSGFIRVDRVEGTEKDIVRYARLRTDVPTRATKEAINFLVEHGLLAPFGLVGLVLEIRAPKFVKDCWFRQHAAWRNEVASATNNVEDYDELEYANLSYLFDPEFYLPDDVPHAVRDSLAEDQETLSTHRAWYLRQGVSPLTAALNMPASQYVEWYWRDNLHNLLRWLATQRRYRPAARELAAYADTVETIINAHFPLTHAAWLCDREGIYLTKNDVEELKTILWGKLLSKHLYNQLYPACP